MGVRLGDPAPCPAMMKEKATGRGVWHYPALRLRFIADWKDCVGENNFRTAC